MTEVLLTVELGVRRKVLGALLQLCFGLHGVFSYLASSLMGAVVGVQLHVYGQATRAFLLYGAFGSVMAFAVGLSITCRLRNKSVPDGLFAAQPAQDAFTRATSHNRLLFGAGDFGIVLLCLGVVEASPVRRELWRRASQSFRRLAEMSLTIYALHDVYARFVFLLFARLARTANLTLAGISFGQLMDLVEPFGAASSRRAGVDMVSGASQVLPELCSCNLTLILTSDVVGGAS